jgi:hypothetical protein
MKEYAFKGKDGVGLFGNLGKTFTGVTTNPDVRYDPVNEGYINIKTGMPVSGEGIFANFGQGARDLITGWRSSQDKAKLGMLLRICLKGENQTFQATRVWSNWLR